MEQKVVNDPMATAIELSINNRDVFSEDFKHYAKMVYLGQVSRTMLANSFSIDPEGRLQFGGGSDPQDPKAKAQIIKDIAAVLCGVAARSVATLMSDISAELSDDNKLNEAMTELFGDRWDPEKRAFKRN